MYKVLLVAWREFKHTALTKAFILGAVLTPVGIAAVMFLMPKLLRTDAPPLKGTLAIIDVEGDWTPNVEFLMQPDRLAEYMNRFRGSPDDIAALQTGGNSGTTRPRLEVDVKRFTAGDDIAALKDGVRSGEYLALAIPAPGAFGSGSNEGPNSFELFVQSDAVPNHTEGLQDALASSIVRTRVQRAGVDIETARNLVREPHADTKRLITSGGEAGESTKLRMLIPLGFMMLLWIGTFTTGQYLLTTTIEEKSNKVMEVLLSAVSPFQLMTGKILGQAAVAILMLGMYGGLAIAVMIALAKFDLIPISHLVYLSLYFIMAFFMIASIMAGVGSAVSELREAQSLITPAMLLLMIPLLLWFPIINDPNGVLATITSFIPPLIPFVMILRVTAASEPVPFWQIIATLVAGYCWMVVMIWMCAKIFRIGVLMTGKPPTPLELLRWVRYK